MHLTTFYVTNSIPCRVALQLNGGPCGILAAVQAHVLTKLSKVRYCSALTLALAYPYSTVVLNPLHILSTTMLTPYLVDRLPLRRSCHHPY